MLHGLIGVYGFILMLIFANVCNSWRTNELIVKFIRMYEVHLDARMTHLRKCVKFLNKIEDAYEVYKSL